MSIPKWKKKIDKNRYKSHHEFADSIAHEVDKYGKQKKGICPQCGSLLVYPRGGTPYCEDCGYPDEDFDEQE